MKNATVPEAKGPSVSAVAQSLAEITALGTRKNLLIFAEEQRQPRGDGALCARSNCRVGGCCDVETSDLLRIIHSENPQPKLQALYGAPNLRG
jgi:hypothetical protein